MIIVIPDELTPTQRKELLQAMPVRYAFQKMGVSYKKAGDFLGCSDRFIRDLVNRNEYLSDYRKEKKEIKSEIGVAFYDDDRGPSNDEAKELLIRSTLQKMVKPYMSNAEKAHIEENLRNSWDKPL